MFSWYKYLIVNLVFSHLGFWSGNLFLISPFPDLCLLVSFDGFVRILVKNSCHSRITRKCNGPLLENLIISFAAC